ncbi:putative methyltransferase-domain-containing protein [Tuber borchii]|uniref:Putative methyltransferase-domain-containing protein n=1 Tax=Tuber borchii TaxID=42251 RepID=A0A2T7A5R4_TUBBO|nr:putative methyltransferase-domain-containing protein [Tuber borchii]
MAPALILSTLPPELEEFSFQSLDVSFHDYGDDVMGLMCGWPLVFDLPALNTRPPVESLLYILNGLAIAPTSWEKGVEGVVDPPGLSKWLVTIIASPLEWIRNDEVKEVVWEAASTRLAERCGRTAMPSQTRTFQIPLPFSQKSINLSLHEPTLTADNLGLKTWASSYLLSKRLPLLGLPTFSPSAKALELGAGTGLVGLAAAAIFKIPILLTDLPDIVPNLQHNANTNSASGTTVSVSVMDWRDGVDEVVSEGEKYDLVLAADPLYSPEHPRLLVGMVRKWLKKGTHGRAVVEMPLRDGYGSERGDFRSRMERAGLEIKSEGVETGVDDWGAGGEVECWWSVWGWNGDCGVSSIKALGDDVGLD